MGSESIDLRLGNVWNAWFAFRKGKRMSNEMHEFQYYLEKNLYSLYEDLNSQSYKHGTYRHFTVCDNKRREISVSCIRDRVVHRLIYDFLLPIWDQIFIYDVWSCRKDKGLLVAIERTQSFLKSYPDHFVWRVDIKKFFDNVDQEVLVELIKRRVSDEKALWLLKEVIHSYSSHTEGKGMPIGNLTSQIFSNIYLNELDRLVKHSLKPKAYLRYGDDFVLFEQDRNKLENMRTSVVNFLNESLKASVNPKNDILIKARHGLKFLGLNFWFSGRRLNKRNKKRIVECLNSRNVASYHGMVAQHEVKKIKKWFDWLIYQKVSLVY